MSLYPISHPSDAFNDIRQPLLNEKIVLGMTADENRRTTHLTTSPFEHCGVLSAALVRQSAKALMCSEEGINRSGGGRDVQGWWKGHQIYDYPVPQTLLSSHKNRQVVGRSRFACTAYLCTSVYRNDGLLKLSSFVLSLTVVVDSDKPVGYHGGSCGTC